MGDNRVVDEKETAKQQQHPMCALSISPFHCLLGNDRKARLDVSGKGSFLLAATGSGLPLTLAVVGGRNHLGRCPSTIHLGQRCVVQLF